MYRLLPVFFILCGPAIADDISHSKSASIYLTSAAINVLEELIPMLPGQEGEGADCYVVTAGNLDENPHWIADEIDAIAKKGRKVRPIDLAALSDRTMESALDN